MISENELRLGNLVKDRGGKIIRIDFFEHLENNYDCKFGQHNKISDDWGPLHPLTEYTNYAEPIPLTEEILVKCGFKKEKASNYGGADSWQGMDAYSYNGEWLFRGDCNGLKLVGYFNTNFEYLHQIQNIMYFLYGKELEVNL